MQDVDLKTICDGMIRIRNNAADLLQDARLLREKGRVARAYALAYMACEECGKLSILIGAAVRTVVGIPVEWKAIRKRFHSHDSKASQFLGLARAIPLILETATAGRKTVNAEELVIKASVGVLFGPALLPTRNASIYCDFFEGAFAGPGEKITELIADQMIGYANTNLTTADHLTSGSPEDVAGRISTSFSRERYDRMMMSVAEVSEWMTEAFRRPNRRDLRWT